ncbi:coil containing protein [Vibrio phage 1.031.O._10N.261.46.F8]|nr:coil containing protein [Vibrio phage 1.031.O._10N.261.46.F8]
MDSDQVSTVKSAPFRKLIINRIHAKSEIERLQKELDSWKGIDDALMCGQVAMVGSCPHCQNSHFPWCNPKE